MNFYKAFLFVAFASLTTNQSHINAMQPATSVQPQMADFSFIDFTKRCFACPEFNFPITDRSNIKANSFSNKFISAAEFISLLDCYFQKINPLEDFTSNLSKNSCASFIQVVPLEPLLDKDEKPIKTIDHIATAGDIHGSIHSTIRDLWQIVCDPSFQLDNQLKLNGEKVVAGIGHRSKIVFTGDYIDRGRYSIESLFLVIQLYLANPDQVFLIRGNHENLTTYILYTLLSEIDQKYAPDDAKIIKEKVERFFNTLPVAVLFKRTDEQGLPSNILFCHGGFPLSFKPDTKIKRWTCGEILDLNSLPPCGLVGINESNTTGFLMSDFVHDVTLLENQLTPNFIRFEGCMANQQTGQQWLSIMNLLCLVRGHQHGEYGTKLLFKNFDNLKRFLLQKYINQKLNALIGIDPNRTLANMVAETFKERCMQIYGPEIADTTYNLSFWESIIPNNTLDKTVFANPTTMENIDKIFTIEITRNGKTRKINTLIAIVLAENSNYCGPINFKDVLKLEDFTPNGVCLNTIIPILTNSTAVEGASLPEDCINILTISPINAECTFYPHTTNLAKAWTTPNPESDFAAFPRSKYTSISLHERADIENIMHKTNIDLKYQETPFIEPISQDLIQQAIINTRNHYEEQNVICRDPDASPATTVTQSPAVTPTPGTPSPTASPAPIGKNSTQGLQRPSALRQSESAGE